MFATFDTPECLVCLALLYEVLYISTFPNYVWMVEAREVPRMCDCLDNTKLPEKTFTHHYHSLRPVSSEEVESHVLGSIDEETIHLTFPPILEPNEQETDKVEVKQIEK
uniref:AlNc14C348G10881 protein n=1 Tax=Albugo laibachii Nc14 TaxID=890382 RepID=F0WXC9_9STRA|nr:AlNc14C348G10881 [Albugo laibachii Nc14]|eukprot:CCA26121.1 AlNc14C348G10881 [Albugo laibachii Nc14]